MSAPLRKLSVVDASSTASSWSELVGYRDLFAFLVWRDIKGLYAQSILGLGWAIFQPLVTMVIFTIVFGGLAKVPSDGVPYAVFSFCALVPWTFFSNAARGATTSLVASARLLTKIYFPRLVIPVSAVVSKLVDFLIAMAILLLMMAWYGYFPGPGALLLPFLVLLLMATSLGIGLWSSALAVRYRDVNHASSFVVQLLIYAAPVIYPASQVPEPWRLAYGLFPMAGVIEGFRSALLGSNPMPWDLIAVGTLSASLLLAAGLWFFRRAEHDFADIV